MQSTVRTSSIFMITSVMLFLAFSLQGVSARADLVEQVDQLSSKRAYLFMNKLQAKVFDPIREDFFTNLSVNISAGTAFVDAQAYNQRLHPLMERFNNLAAMKVNLLWRTESPLSFGLMLGALQGQQSKMISSDMFQRSTLHSGFVDFGVSYQIPLNGDFFLAPGIGVGITMAAVEEESTNDTAKTTYLLRAMGVAPHLMVEIPIHYRLTPLWTVSFTNAFQFANLTRLNRAEDERASVPALNLSGYQGTLGLSVNF